MCTRVSLFHQYILLLIKKKKKNSYYLGYTYTSFSVPTPIISVCTHVILVSYRLFHVIIFQKLLVSYCHARVRHGTPLHARPNCFFFSFLFFWETVGVTLIFYFFLVSTSNTYHTYLVTLFLVYILISKKYIE